MAFILEKELPPIEEILKRFPVLPEHDIESRRTGIHKVLCGEDRRLLVVEGPCSFLPTKAGLEHTRIMAKIQEEVADALLLVERVYSQKPRTRGGWPGILTHPDPLDPNGDAELGEFETRRAMFEAAKILPIADEMLNPTNVNEFADLLSYIAVGARTVESDPHRIAASGLDAAVGMKNSRDGNSLPAVDAVCVAQQPGKLVSWGRKQLRATGNPYAHVILRGGVDAHDKVVANWGIKEVDHTSNLLRKAEVKNPSIVIDASHDNARDPETGKKTLDRQKVVLRSLAELIEKSPHEYALVRGVMIENYMIGGNQPISPDMRMDGLSITDPCLSLEDSKIAIYALAEASRRRMRKL